MRKSLCVLGFLLCCIVALAQDIRCSYTFWKKNAPEEKYKVYRDMKTDYHVGRSIYYSERAFVWDSLSRIAFNEQGVTVDEDAYTELTRKRKGLQETSICDFSAGMMIQVYQDINQIIVGTQALVFPEWTLLDETKEINGYPCKKAETDFLGRKWSIWYTEDIPVQSGPWFLWGAPGLIVKAQDSDNLMVFQLTGIECLSDTNRMARIVGLYQNNQSELKQVIDLPLERAESLYLKMKTDTDFFYQMQGITGIYRIDSNGNKSDFTLPSYVPLIPIEFWKK